MSITFGKNFKKAKREGSSSSKNELPSYALRGIGGILRFFLLLLVIFGYA